MEIRRARPDEAALLTELVMAAKAHWGYSEQQLEAWRSALTVTRELLTSHSSFVLEGEDVVGFYSLRLDGESGSLDNLWVRPPEARRGYGRVLFDHAKQFARSAGATELLIDADPHAVAFYVRCGATIVGHVSAPIEGQPYRCRPQLRLLLKADEAVTRENYRSAFDGPIPASISFRTYGVFWAMVGLCVLMADVALTSLWKARELTSDVSQFAGLFLLCALPTWAVFAWLRRREARLAEFYSTYLGWSRREYSIWFICVIAFVLARTHG